MQTRLCFLAVLTAGAACGGGGGVLVDGGPDTPSILEITPDNGPLGGGLRVTITGSGFLANGAPPNRVVIGGREAAAAGVIDDETLEVVIPPGDASGSVDVTLFNANGYAEAAGAFRYRDLPVVTSVTPAEVVYSAASTQMTIIGSGFTADDAGAVSVFIDGFRAVDVDVVNDTTITFTATAGPALALPDIRVENDNGEAVKVDGFRYVPATADGLLLFAQSPETFAFYFDPATSTTIAIPAVDNDPSTFQQRVIRSAVQDPSGVFWAQTRAGGFGQLDLSSQTIADPILGGPRMSALGRLGDTLYAVEGNSRFGTVDTETGQITTLGPPLDCCGSFGIAANAGGTVFLVNAGTIGTVDPATGVRGTAVPLSPNLNVADMRFFNGTLYAVTNVGTLVTINPTTGATAVVTTLTAPRLNAIEVFQ